MNFLGGVKGYVIFEISIINCSVSKILIKKDVTLNLTQIKIIIDDIINFIITAFEEKCKVL